MTAVEKLKPQYLEEIISVLSSVRDFPKSLLEHKESIGKKLQSLAKMWPKSRFYVKCKKQLLRLLRSWEVKVEFSKGVTKPAPVVSNGNKDEASEEVSSVTKKKKKKKKKSQEKLKNDKEFKFKQAKDQENTEIPSFSELVQDTLNKDVVESPKRKATEEAVKPKKKKKK